MLLAKRPRLIVGVDPGTTLGLAALDLDGRPLLLTSGKNFSKGKVLELLLETGSTAVIASDRVVPPHLISELASSLGATIYLPSQEASPVEKERLVEEASKKLGVQVSDRHQSAALYAALKAYDHFEALFRDVEKAVSVELQRKGPQLVEEAKALVIKGIPPGKSVKTLLLGAEPAKVDQNVLNALRKENKYYKERLLSTRAELAEAKAEIRRLRLAHPRSREKNLVTSIELQETREELRKALHEIEELRRQLEPFRPEVDGRIRLYMLGPLSVSSIKSAIEEGTIAPDRPIYAPRVEGDAKKCAKALASAGTRTVVLEFADEIQKRAFMDNGIVAISASSIAIDWKSGVPWVLKSDLFGSIGKQGKELEALRRQRIREIIDSYREERMQEK